MKALLRLIGLVVAIFLFALLVDQIAPLKKLDIYLKAHPQPWTGLALGAVIIGFGLLCFAWISWVILTGRPMSEDEARTFMSTNAGSPGFRRVFGGEASGITTPEGTATFREIKDGLRSGAWLHDARLRAFCAGAAGVLLLVVGGFGYFIVSGPLAVKLLCAGALLYAFGRTVWGFWKA